MQPAFPSEFHRACTYAMVALDNQQHDAAIAELRIALRHCNHPRAFSKLMLAIRETKRAQRLAAN